MKQILCGCGVAEELFQICGGELNEDPKEISLFGITPSGVPEPFENFVTFPPVGEVVEINPIPIVI